MLVADGVLLSAEDRAILDLECATVVGHTCKVIGLTGTVTAAQLRERIASRLAAAPMLTRRLDGLPDAPQWVPDPDFAVERHVVDVPGPARDDAGVRRLIAELFAQHLDRDRPLWRMDVAATTDGGTVLVWRLHHALADGTMTMRLAEALLWDDAAPPAVAAVAVAVAVAVAESPDHARRRRHLASFLHREFGASAHRSPFDGDVGTRREIGFTLLGLADLRSAGHRLARATVNDALLAIVAGALRRYIEAQHGSLVDVRIRVPVSLHHEGDSDPNRDSYFSLPLPLHIADPVARLRAIHAATALRKADHDAELLDDLMSELARTAPQLQQFARRVQSSPRRFAVCLSNVPGPRRPVAVLGVPARFMAGFAEIGQRHALRLAAVSLDDQLSLGFCADPSLVPDVQSMAAAAQAEYAALVAATG